MATGNLSAQVEQSLRQKYGNMRADIEKWKVTGRIVYVDASHPAHDIALVRDSDSVSLYYKDKDPQTAPTPLIATFFLPTGSFEKGTTQGDWIDICAKWLTRVTLDQQWTHISFALILKRDELDQLIACVQRFLQHLETARIRRRIEDRMRKDDDFVLALATIMGIS